MRDRPKRSPAHEGATWIPGGRAAGTGRAPSQIAGLTGYDGPALLPADTEDDIEQAVDDAIRSETEVGVSPRPFVLAVAVAASMSFMTPIGHQTSTMMYGPGHYRFTDYTRIGGPLNLLVLVVSTVTIPFLWPF